MKEFEYSRLEDGTIEFKVLAKPASPKGLLSKPEEDFDLKFKSEAKDWFEGLFNSEAGTEFEIISDKFAPDTYDENVTEDEVVEATEFNASLDSDIVEQAIGNPLI